jgi:CRP-like cAMP-binding protein
MYDPLLQAISKHVSLTTDEQMIVCSLAQVKKLRKRQYLLQEGEVSKTENYVLKGCLRTYEVNDKGQEHVSQFSVEDWWVGDLYSFLTGTPSTYNIDCIEDSELLQFSRAALDEMYERVPKMERFFRILIQNAYIASTKRVASSMSKPALDRYIDFLKSYPHIDQRVPNHQVASYLGITPESLSRIRKQYAAGGFP